MWRDLWFDNEMSQKVDQALSNGLCKIDPKSGLMVPRSDELSSVSNWIFFGTTHQGHDCFLWHHVMFNLFGLVPEFCRMRCYKVVVKIPTVEALFKFNNFAGAIPALGEFHCPMHGKCGIDTRWYTGAAYDAFFYCDGLEEGREKYKIVKELIGKYFEGAAEGFPLILKRSCTEFEKRYGPTDGEFWKGLDKEEKDLQRHLEGIFAPNAGMNNQSDWVKNKIMRRWIEHANMFGDKSWVDYYGGKDFLTMKAVTYHEEGGERVTSLGDFVPKKEGTKGVKGKVKRIKGDRKKIAKK